MKSRTQELTLLSSVHEKQQSDWQLSATQLFGLKGWEAFKLLQLLLRVAFNGSAFLLSVKSCEQQTAEFKWLGAI